MARVLVTGGTGFIGSHLTRALRARGDDVALFVRDLQTATQKIADGLLPEGCHLYEGDIRNYEDVLAAFTAFQPELVFHTAATLSRGTSAIGEEDAVTINQKGTQHVVDAIAHMKGVSPVRGAVMFGSSVEYGLSTVALREDTVCNPVGSYAVTKYQGTLYAMTKAHEEHLPIISLRVFTPYGSGMSAASFVSNVVARATKNEEITLSGTSVTRDFVYVDDLVALSLELIERAHSYPGEIFNAGSGQATTLHDFATRVVELSESESKIVIDDTLFSAQDNALWQADMTKTLGAVAWRPQTDLDAGIRKILEQIPQ